MHNNQNYTAHPAGMYSYNPVTNLPGSSSSSIFSFGNPNNKFATTSFNANHGFGIQQSLSPMFSQMNVGDNSHNLYYSNKSQMTGDFKAGYSNISPFKRKLELPSPHPTKIHVTEERMAKQLAELHISSQSSPAEKEEPEPVREQRLYMCSEMQRFQAEEIIPAQILEHISRPCTALVPWTPPIIPTLLQEANNNNNNNNTLNNNNKNEEDEEGQIEVDVEMDS